MSFEGGLHQFSKANSFLIAANAQSKMTQRKAETEMEAAKAPINSEIEKVEMN